jgi:hypothetical protein
MLHLKGRVSRPSREFSVGAEFESRVAVAMVLSYGMRCWERRGCSAGGV